MANEPINDGGPAFPVVCEGGTNSGLHAQIEHGMSLRDWFAGQAMAAIYADFNNWGTYGEPQNPGPDIAKRAYLLADAMTKERDVKP